MSADVARTVQTELRRHVSDRPLVVPVVHDVIARLSPQLAAHIAALQSPRVHIDIGNVYCFTVVFRQLL